MARVLVVEDTDEIRALLEIWIAGAGHDVQPTGTAEDALERARECPPDIVVCDLGLPGMDGLELCRRLRSFLEAPILVLSAAAGAKTDAAARKAGATDFMVKPFRRRGLLDRIAALLQLGDVAGPPG